MEHIINRKKYRIFATDFETHNDEESIAKRETSVWLGVLIDETSKRDDEASYFYDIEEFIDRIEKLSSVAPQDRKTNKRNIRNICIYDYNLSFEWSFILPALLRRGFKFKDNIEKDDEFVFNSVSTRSVSSVWTIQLKFHKNSGIVLFRDLAKIYGGGLRNVARSFNLPTQKGEIDYRKNRLHNYKVTQEEKYYCFDDVHIIIEILQQVDARGDAFFWSSASASTYSMKNLLKTGWPRSIKPYKEFRKEYPVLDERETNFLRKAVSGGITYAPKLYQYKEINRDILHIDMHQAHPTSAYLNLFPYGEGEYFVGKPTRYFKYINIIRIRISYDDVKLHSVIELIGMDAVDGYELTIFDFELPTMYKCYVNLQVEYIDGYRYHARPLRWREYYNRNYQARKKAKEIKDEFGKMYYKLLNNSSYGKLLERPHNFTFANTINDEGIITSDVIEKEELEIGAKYTYLPVGAAIPAYTRVRLVETALLFGWRNVCYFDTDSIFIILNEQTREVWETSVNQADELGGWGLEAIHERGQFACPKRYKVVTDGELDVKAGGINFNDYINTRALETGVAASEYEVSFEEINIVSSKWRVQRAYRVKGGTLIEFQEKEMSVQDKYLEVYNRNYGKIEV